MKKLSALQTLVLIFLSITICIVLITKQEPPSSPAGEISENKTVSVQRLLTFLSDCAAVPPVVEADKTCQHQPLPRSDQRTDLRSDHLNIS